MNQYLSILKLSADTPSQLRRCDVYRVMEAAFNQGCLGTFYSWLTTQQVTDPVKKEAREIYQELTFQN